MPARARHALIALVTGLLVLGVASAAGAVKSGPLTWGRPQVVDPPRGGLFSVSCVTHTFCLAGDGTGRVLRYNGTKWSTLARIGSTYPVVGQLDCVSTTFCGATLESKEGYRPMTFDGKSWTKGRPVVSGEVGGLSCASRRLCILVDSGFGMFQRWDGHTWSAPKRFDGHANLELSVSCPTTTYCVAADGNGRVLTYNGTTWSSTAKVIDPHVALTDIACPTTSFCLAVDARGRGLIRKATVWIMAGAPANRIGLSLDCPTATFCAVVDEAGEAFMYTHGKWSAPVTIAKGYLGDVSCSSSSLCVAVSLSGEAINRSGGHWHPALHPDPAFGGLNAVSCASTTFCVAVDGSGGKVTFNGTAWSKAGRVDYHSDGFAGVSCPSAAFCVAVTYSGFAYRVVNGHWSARTALPVDSIEAVSCASATMCLAVSFDGQAASFDGKIWTSAPVSDDELSSVSCRPGICVAGDYQGSVLTFDGAWSAAKHIVKGSITSISCTPGYCLAVTSTGATYGNADGSADWVSAGKIPASAFFSVSCTSDHFCVAVADRRESTYNGSTWTKLAAIDTSRGGLTAVSCVAKSLCVAVDPGQGSALVAS